MILLIEGFNSASALDLNMGYYNKILDADSDAQKLCIYLYFHGRWNSHPFSYFKDWGG
jgi:hypothetical protein